MSRALLLQEATSCQKQQSKVLPTAALTHPGSAEPLSYHQDGQQEGRLSSASFRKSLLVWAASEEKCLPSCPQHKQAAMAALWAGPYSQKYPTAGRAQFQSSTFQKRLKNRYLSRQEVAWQVLHGFSHCSKLHFWVFHKPALLGPPPKAWLWRGCSCVRLHWCLVKLQP